VSGGAAELLLVFTDLDGSLLDHRTYSYLDAMPQLHALEHRRIPIIFATSKTRVETEGLRRELGNDHPFMVENGAAVFIPRDYFSGKPAQTVERDGYWVREFTHGREQWLSLLDELQPEFGDEFDHFHRAGVEGIVRMTGLSPERAAEADRREYSEPVQWLGSETRRRLFVGRLAEAGATVLEGGRFLSVSGDCDKGRALEWLRDAYRHFHGGLPCHDLAAGDSGNDTAMLEVAETALVIRSPVHDPPPLRRLQGVIYSRDFGPAGWAEGVAHWLSDRDRGRVS